MKSQFEEVLFRVGFDQESHGFERTQVFLLVQIANIEEEFLQVVEDNVLELGVFVL